MFSIIVPVHNVEAYVDYCIKSIISQSFSEFELILVVNASGDGSYKICKNWEEKDSRIHVIYTEVPGVSHARNLGLKESKGEWIIFVDADDYLFHNACNYGAFLQTKALSEFINEQCEREVYIVDYKNKSIINDYSVRNVFNFNQGLKTTILKIMRLPDILKRNSIFNMYQKDTFKLVKVNDISEYKISKVVVGSDQVWNLELTGGDLNYFLPFVEPECRISYAASVGHDL